MGIGQAQGQYWSGWGDWYGPYTWNGNCRYYAFRYCIGGGCDGPIYRSKSCPSGAIDGGWGPWGEWGDCAGGSQARQRACDNPRPSSGGLNCVGDDTETAACTAENMRR